MSNQNEFMQNAQGHLVPVAQVSPLDQSRDEMVKDLINLAERQSNALIEFKTVTNRVIKSFLELAAEEYDTNLGGKKGNITLTSYDGQYKVEVNVNDFITFDERLQIAKQLIDECIQEWSKESRSEIVALVNDAFAVRKKGKVDIPRILSLRNLQIEHPKWKQAMQAISDSIKVTGSKRYIRFYKKNRADDKYQMILLDFASM